jgi:predicted aconitase
MFTPEMEKQFQEVFGKADENTTNNRDSLADLAERTSASGRNVELLTVGCPCAGTSVRNGNLGD